MNNLQSCGKTFYLKVGKDTRLIDILGRFGAYKSDKFRTVGEDKKSYIIEIMPPKKLDITMIQWWK